MALGVFSMCALSLSAYSKTILCTAKNSKFAVFSINNTFPVFSDYA